MPIDTKHPEYTANQDIWNKCIDFYEGEEAVKDAGSKYLPKLSGQDTQKYNAYRDRALFYNAVGRTVAALVAAVFARPTSIDLPAKLEYLRENATDQGDSLEELLSRVLTRQMMTGRCGILGDRAGDSQPYLVVYDELQIINWKVTGDPQFVILQETYEEVDPKDRFKVETKTRYRELAYENERYIMRVWEQQSHKKFTVVSETTPTKNGKEMEFVPFVCITPTGLNFEVDRPPILDMVNVLATHYRTSADIFNAYHTICIPTPYVTGVQNDETSGDSTLKLGADTAIFLPETGSRVGYLEFQGQGVKSVEDALTKMENMLAALGARLVETQKKSFVETAEGVRTRESAAVAVLNSAITSVEASINKLIKQMAVWENADPDEVNIKINRDLVTTPVSENMVIALTRALQSGSISFETFFHNLQEGQMYPPEATVEEEMDNIDKFIEERSAKLKEHGLKNTETFLEPDRGIVPDASEMDETKTDGGS